MEKIVEVLEFGSEKEKV